MSGAVSGAVSVSVTVVTVAGALADRSLNRYAVTLPLSPTVQRMRLTPGLEARPGVSLG
jgi:hypothetical protein